MEALRDLGQRPRFVPQQERDALFIEAKARACGES